MGRFLKGIDSNTLFLGVFFLFILLSNTGNSRANSHKVQPDTFIKKINELSSRLLTRISDEEKHLINDTILSELRVVLEQPEDKLPELDSLNRLIHLQADNNKIRVLSWMIPLESGSFEYFGYIRVNHPDSIALYELNDASAINDDYENIDLSPGNWYGALYYEMIECEFEDSVFYTIIGWKGNNQITTKKVIDVVHINEKGLPVFGLPVFQLNDTILRHRVIYEYSAEVAMNVSYDPELKTIVMDHLFPSSPELKGHYEFYGPDLSFDAFSFENGKWKYIDDYDPGIRPDNKEFDLKKGVRIYKP